MARKGHGFFVSRLEKSADFSCDVIPLWYLAFMPRKIRQLIKDLEKSGFAFRPGKGSHRKMQHPCGASVIVSGNLGDDAHSYQEKRVKEAIQESKKGEPK